MTWFRSLRRLLDVWSVPHFLFGMVMAIGALAFEWPIRFAFASTVIIALLWEQFESRIGIYERPGNPLMDILLPLLAFGMTLILVDQAPLHQDQHVGLFVSVAGLFLFVNAAAWKARFERDRDFLK